MLHHHVRPLGFKEIVNLILDVGIFLGQLLELVLALHLVKSHLFSLFLEGLLLPSNELLDVLLVIDLLHLLVLVAVIDGIVNSVLDYFIFYIFEHHIEAVLDVVLCPTRHLLYYFSPFVSNL